MSKKLSRQMTGLNASALNSNTMDHRNSIASVASNYIGGSSKDLLRRPVNPHPDRIPPNPNYIKAKIIEDDD